MQETRKAFLRRALGSALFGLGLPTLLVGCGPAMAEKKSDKPTDKTAKAAPAAQPKAGQQAATFAAGCFWSVEAMFKQLKGVSSAEPGYTGGTVDNPTYEQVCSGNTGHAECVNVVFDPKVITYRELVEIFLLIHDPTTLNRQGADQGTQYRSAIFYRDDAQKKDAEAIIKKISTEAVYQDPIVTKLEAFKTFYRAEEYHLDYYNRNPNTGYCARVVSPKIEKFRNKFKTKLKG